MREDIFIYVEELSQLYWHETAAFKALSWEDRKQVVDDYHQTWEWIINDDLDAMIKKTTRVRF